MLANIDINWTTVIISAIITGGVGLSNYFIWRFIYYYIMRGGD